MGNCLPRSSKKNRVEPAPEEEDVHELLSRSTEFRTPKANAPEDMAKALKQEGTAGSTNVPNEATPKRSKKAVTFAVDFEDKTVKPRMPKRLAERMNTEKEPTNEIDYTLEEELLMADIVREDSLKERKEKARQEDIKIYDASRRRMVIERTNEARAEIKTRCSTPSLDGQRKTEKGIADDDRRNATEKRKEEQI